MSDSQTGGLSDGLLYTDFYQLTMAQTYFARGVHEQTARFEHFFRQYPDYGDHQAGYCVSAGVHWFLDWLDELKLSGTERQKLEAEQTPSGKPVFDTEFLDWLSDQRLDERLKVRAIPEGRIVHPNVPLTVVEGPIALAQLVETPLLNMINYQTLIATKASRIRRAGEAQLFLEFGMRRSHDRAANAGARGAMIGGADFSSNTGQSYEMNTPPKGTHAHSFIQSFLARGKSEKQAFKAFAETFPESCILLVDTIDTLESGIPNAIEVFEELREKGYEPVGIRLDSGDLAHLAVRAAKMLTQAGFGDTTIVLSNQLDEQVLIQILQQIRDEAPDYGLDPESVIDRLAYGVGTSLITSKGDSALDGVFKLVALEEQDEWQPVLKISENPKKIPNPGRKSVWRLYDQRNKASADVITNHDRTLDQFDRIKLRHPGKDQMSRTVSSDQMGDVEQLHRTVLDQTERTPEPDLETIRHRRQQDLQRLDAGVKRILKPHHYHVSLTDSMWEKKQRLLDEFQASVDS